MKKYNVLISLEQLNIGGIETFVINQVSALLTKDINVTVLAKEGIYTKKLIEMGANVINFEFDLTDSVNPAKYTKLRKIIKECDIDEIHINQFLLIKYLLPICLEFQIPYIAYLHTATATLKDDENNVYNWYESQFTEFKSMYELFFKYAYKIISITKSASEYVIERYKVDVNKIIIINNSIDFSDYKSTIKVNKIKNIMLISRMSHEKYQSIISGIKFFKQLKDSFKHQIHLTIAGDGKETEKILSYLKEALNEEDYTYLGAINNVKKQMDKNDLIIGVDRCILEAIALQKISIISSYEGNIDLVQLDNIDECIEYNFSGENIKKNNSSNIIKYLKEINIKKTNENLKQLCVIAYSKLDINKNAVTFNIKEYQYPSYFNNIILQYLKIIEVKNKKLIEQSKRSDEIYTAKLDLEKENILLKKKLDQLGITKIYKFFNFCKKRNKK